MLPIKDEDQAWNLTKCSYILGFQDIIVDMLPIKDGDEELTRLDMIALASWYYASH